MWGEYPPQSALDMLMAEHDAEDDREFRRQMSEQFLQRMVVAEFESYQITPVHTIELPDGYRGGGVWMAEMEDLFRDEEGM